VFAPHVPAGSTVIDVGAHAGQFSKLFSRLVGPAGAVHAFEPSRYTRRILKAALAANRCRNVSVHAAGLSDQPGVLTLSTPVKTSGLRAYGLASLGGVAARTGRGEIAEEVPVTTLDEFVSDNALQVAFIKADIEGWEAHLVRGAARTLAAQKPALFMEIDAALIARAGDDAAALLSYLIALGYTAFKAPAWTTPAPAYAGPGDYLFVA
jgi:FkbM family methyltransferase